MALVTQPLRDEHREMLPEIEVLRDAAIGADSGDASEPIARAVCFLQGHFISPAQAEEAALYPVVARLMGAPAATATMTRDHVEVGRLTEELASLRDHWKDTADDRVEARRFAKDLRIPVVAMRELAIAEGLAVIGDGATAHPPPNPHILAELERLFPDHLVPFGEYERLGMTLGVKADTLRRAGRRAEFRIIH